MQRLQVNEKPPLPRLHHMRSRQFQANQMQGRHFRLHDNWCGWRCLPGGVCIFQLNSMSFFHITAMHKAPVYWLVDFGFSFISSIPFHVYLRRRMSGKTGATTMWHFEMARWMDIVYCVSKLNRWASNNRSTYPTSVKIAFVSAMNQAKIQIVISVWEESQVTLRRTSNYIN